MESINPVASSSGETRKAAGICLVFETKANLGRPNVPSPKSCESGGLLLEPSRCHGIPAVGGLPGPAWLDQFCGKLARAKSFDLVCQRSRSCGANGHCASKLCSRFVRLGSSRTTQLGR